MLLETCERGNIYEHQFISMLPLAILIQKSVFFALPVHVAADSSAGSKLCVQDPSSQIMVRGLTVDCLGVHH